MMNSKQGVGLSSLNPGHMAGGRYSPPYRTPDRMRCMTGSTVRLGARSAQFKITRWWEKLRKAPIVSKQFIFYEARGVFFFILVLSFWTVLRTNLPECGVINRFRDKCVLA